MAERAGLQVKVKGIVQGVGFRPFVYQLANRLELKGWVRNTTAGVDIQVDGSHDALQNFVESLRTQAPPLAHIDEIQTLPSSAKPSNPSRRTLPYVPIACANYLIPRIAIIVTHL